MTRRRHSRGRLIPVLVVTFIAGMVAGWSIRRPVERTLAARAADVPLLPTGTMGDVRLPRATDRATSTTETSDAAATMDSREAHVDSHGAAAGVLQAKRLELPVAGADVKAMRGQFGDPRDQGSRGHEAVDILAPRNTPVHAVEDGTIAKLFLSRQGGITVYQFDPTNRFCYYYAHLEGYAPRLHEGEHVSRGDVLGYVGTTGNAPANTPHLHFAIFELTPERRWWEGAPIDPWLAFSH